MPFDGKTIVVTGGAGAMGSGIVQRLHASGAKVAILDSVHGQGRAEELAASLGSRALAVALDLASAGAWKDALAKISAFGEPAGAVLCAGGWAGGKPFAAGGDHDLGAMIHGNVTTVERSLAALLPGMVARKGGSVVVVGSRNVERPWLGAGSAAYTASKAAVVALAEAIAAETRAFDVRINAVLPSTIDTPANRAAMPDVDPATWVSVDSLADVVLFLLSDAARDVSGAAIPVYGKA